MAKTSIVILIFATSMCRTKAANNLFEGTYTQDEVENFDPYMDALEVSSFLQIMAGVNKACPTITRDCPSDDLPLSSSDCLWTIKTKTSLRNHEVSFRFGEEVKDHTIDDRDVVAVYTYVSPTVFTEVQRGEKVNYVTRTFSPEGLRVDLKVENVSAVVHFNRLD